MHQEDKGRPGGLCLVLPAAPVEPGNSQGNNKINTLVMIPFLTFGLYSQPVTHTSIPVPDPSQFSQTLHVGVSLRKRLCIVSLLSDRSCAVMPPAAIFCAVAAEHIETGNHPGDLFTAYPAGYIPGSVLMRLLLFNSIKPCNMKSTLKGMMAALLLPVLCFGQSFKAPDFSKENDRAFFAKELEKKSPLIRQLYAAADLRTDMEPEEARALVNRKLDELGNEELKQFYAKLDAEQRVRIGLILHVLLSNLTNLPEGVDSKMQFGGGLGVYLMYTVAQFVLMPELNFWMRSAGGEYGSIEGKERYSHLMLSLTVLYAIQLEQMRLLLGLSPNFGYALGGSYKDGDEDWEDIEFGDGQAKHMNIGLGIVAGIMLQNQMMIRLMYNLGLSKLWDYEDASKINSIGVSFAVPIF